MKKGMLLLLIGWLLSIPSIWAQTQVTGRVLDAREGSPIPGVTVTIKNTRTSTVTAQDGTFSLTAPDRSTLVFTSVGYQAVERAASEGPLTISLTRAEGGLTEVVVTGYRQRTRRDFAGSAGTVTGEKVRDVPIASFDQALQGQTPGLLMRASSGQPGNSGTAIIRGRGTVNFTPNPTYIVDGIEISPNDFALLNPNDIENVSVLKDAVGASLYGSRGGNGVIVVTTRRGRAGAPNVDVEAYTGWSTFPEFRDFRLMNTNEKIDYELRRGGTSLENYTTAQIDSLRRINTDWEKLLTQTGRTYNLNGSVGGGTERSRYFTSVNYYKQEGTLRNTGFDRVTGRVNLSQEVGNFAFGINTTGTYSNYTNTAELNSSISSPLNGLQWANPYEQEFVPGRYNANANFVRGGTTLVRPRVTETFQPIPTTELFVNSNRIRQTRIVAVGNAEYRIPFIEGLSARVVYGLDYNNDERQGFVDRTTASAGSNPRPSTGPNANFRTSSFARDYDRNQRITNTNSLNYNNDFGDHTVDVGVYYEYVQRKNANSGSTVFLLASPFRNEAGATINADLLPRIRGGADERRLQSYFSTLTYGFRNRYFLNANIRRDGSSAFGREKRYATFGGVGVSWVVSDEAFMQGMKDVLSQLKFKASYGTVGFENVGAYESQGIIGGRIYSSAAGTFQQNIENPNLQWEARKKFNTGVDYSLFTNRINGSLEYYNETTENLFLLNELSRTTGFNTLTENVGSVRNTGVEFSANGDVVRGRALTFTLNGNITYNKNEVLTLAAEDTVISGFLIRTVGQPINTLYLVEYVGVNPDNGNAQYRKLDGTITETYNQIDRRSVGTSDPKVFGGFGFNLGYKGIALNTQFTYMLGSKVYNNERANLENPDYYYDNINADLLREWQKRGDITDIPSPTNTFWYETTRFLEDNSFLRLRNITLSYGLPKRLAGGAKVRGASIYVSGTNLWVNTKYRGRDPEFAGSSVTGAQYPALRTVQAGLRLNF